MNLTQIRYFLAVVETGNFTRAAERVNVTQPTLSAGIQRLEEALGAALLERGRGAAQPTPAGAQFLPHARVLLEEWAAARRELRQARPVRHQLRLGYAGGLPPHGLARLLAGFAAQADAALDTLEAAPAVLLRRLDLGRLDAALLVLPEGMDEATSLALLRQRYVLAVPPRHALAHRSSARVAELQDQPFVIRPDAPVMPAAERLFAGANVRPRIVGRAESDTSLLALVEAGLGLAVLPHWLAARDAATVTLPELRAVHTIGLMWRGTASAAVQALASFAAGHDWGPGMRPWGPPVAH
jgi:DNA-binding transcriptional LysR family regulator